MKITKERVFFVLALIVPCGLIIYGIWLLAKKGFQNATSSIPDRLPDDRMPKS